MNDSRLTAEDKALSRMCTGDLQTWGFRDAEAVEHLINPPPKRKHRGNYTKRDMSGWGFTADD